MRKGIRPGLQPVLVGDQRRHEERRRERGRDHPLVLNDRKDRLITRIAGLELPRLAVDHEGSPTWGGRRSGARPGGGPLRPPKSPPRCPGTGPPSLPRAGALPPNTRLHGPPPAAPPPRH